MKNKRPNAEKNHNPDPAYLRELIKRTGLSQKSVAERLAISPRMLRYYLAEAGTDKHCDAPYLVQFGIECLVKEPPKSPS